MCSLLDFILVYDTIGAIFKEGENVMDNDLKKRLEDLRRLSGEVSAICKKESEDRAAFEEKVAIEKEEFKERIAIEKRKFEEKISNDEKEFEKAMRILRKKLKCLLSEFHLLYNDSVSVRLVDLINELSRLTGIKVSNIEVDTNYDVVFNGGYTRHTINELLDSASISIRHGGDESRPNFEVVLKDSTFGSDADRCAFLYFIRSNVKLDEAQADGKMFLEHCTATKSVEYINFERQEYTTLNVKKNIPDLILKISLKDLVRGSDTKCWYPADIMKQAVINCVARSKKREASKKRSRKLSDETKKV